MSEEGQEIEYLGPQPGQQEEFLASSADIVLYGGAAGGGKSYGLLLEAARNVDVEGFGAVIFRRTSKQVRNEGGLWDTSALLYPRLNANPIESTLQWRFPGGAKIKFEHLEHEKNVLDHQGAQYPFIGFDELTHFSEKMFFYMLSRNRSVCGVKPYVRATTNPDADSWVAKFIQWWWDKDTGLPIPERSGVIRYFTRRNNEVIWAGSKKSLMEKVPDIEDESEIKSFTFIMSNIYDNKILMKEDPSYIGNLKALSLVERERLLGGNWKIRPTAGTIFKRGWFEIVDAVPRHTIVRRVRYWDRAATEKKMKNGKETNDPDATSGTLMSVDNEGVYYIEHNAHFFETPAKVRKNIRNYATQDGVQVEIGLEQDPGAAGKSEVQTLVTYLCGFIAKAIPAVGDKVTRAQALSAQAEVGNVKLVRGEWNDDFLTELENFPDASHDDRVDSTSGAFNMLNVEYDITGMITL